MERKKKSRLDDHEEGEGHGSGERWLLTYADMITLLLAFFIIMYSISTTNTKKFVAFVAMVRQGFSIFPPAGDSPTAAESIYYARPETLAKGGGLSVDAGVMKKKTAKATEELTQGVAKLKKLKEKIQNADPKDKEFNKEMEKNVSEMINLLEKMKKDLGNDLAGKIAELKKLEEKLNNDLLEAMKVIEGLNVIKKENKSFELKSMNDLVERISSHLSSIGDQIQKLEGKSEDGEIEKAKQIKNFIEQVDGNLSKLTLITSGIKNRGKESIRLNAKASENVLKNMNQNVLQLIEFLNDVSQGSSESVMSQIAALKDLMEKISVEMSVLSEKMEKLEGTDFARIRDEIIKFNKLMESFQKELLKTEMKSKVLKASSVGLSSEEMNGFNILKGKLSGALEKEIAAGKVKVIIGKRGVTLRIVDTTLFELGKADLTNSAKMVLSRISPIVKGLPNQIIVEGHTDSIPIRNTRYPSNWELSTARATNVIFYFINIAGITPERLAASGYGEYKPVVPNDPVRGSPDNRRVEIIISALNPQG